MHHNIHSDLAVEGCTDNSNNLQNQQGIITNVIEKDEITITEVLIKTKEAERKFNKPIGKYVTVDVPSLRENTSEIYDKTKAELTSELKKFINIKKNSTVMVVGLGNRFVTPDSLGPKVIDKLLVTRHLYGVLPDEITKNMHSLCAVSPGVLGITGIETGEIIKGISDKIKPDIIIAIDALASRKTSRISTTFQIADTGIVPGSGIGNKRKALNKETIGVPVIAIGVPTVIEAVAVANDAIDMLIETIKSSAGENSEFYNHLSEFDSEKRYKLISDVLAPTGNDLIVTPKEVDSMIDEISGIIAGSINDAVNGETAEKLGEIL